MNRDRTLTDLVAVSRARPRERRLCCPDCAGDIELKAGEYVCLGVPYDECRGRGYQTLAELAVR